jgi:hypothetical protein
MSSVPPDRRFQRVLHLAQYDALSLIVVAAPGALLALCTGDRLGAVVGAGISLCGAAEWQGRARLLRRQIAGIAWLCSAQVLCLLLILLYAWNLARMAEAEHLLSLLPDFTRDQLAELLPDPEAVPELLLTIQHAMAGALALAALLYQGGLAFYYLRSIPAARAAFAEPPELMLEPPPHR